MSATPLRQFAAPRPTGPGVVPEFHTNHGPGDGNLKAQESERRRYKRQRALTHGLLGSIFGYAVLHPAAMAVFAYFEPAGDSVALDFVFDRVVQSFSPGMLPMALVFASFSMVIGAMDGYYRSLLLFQRDDLANQLSVNEKYRQQLQGQNADLKELNLTKRRMTYFLVHDLKNHIGCVLGYAKLLLARAGNTGWSGDDRDALAKISRQATRMAGAVSDVLDMARLEHQPQLRTESAPAIPILENAVHAAALGPGEGRVDVDPDVPGDLKVNCNAGMIERVMANLLGNAVKHNGRNVRVNIGVKPDDNGAVFWCTDNGFGIADDIKDSIFEEFTSSSSGKGLVPGYGLGLSFCKAAVEAHRGRSWFETKQGQGTTFFFTIPKQTPATKSDKNGE